MAMSSEPSSTSRDRRVGLSSVAGSATHGLTLATTDGDYELAGGSRRYRAMVLEGLTINGFSQRTRHLGGGELWN